jgi:tetratricopeptide (TPR) repeat protein
MHCAAAEHPLVQTIARRWAHAMTPSPPNSNSKPRRAVLEAVLAAHKAGRLNEVLAQHPRLAGRASRHWLKAVLGTAGDALPVERALGSATTLLLRWGLTQLRPDRAPTLAGIERDAWLDRTSWRPLLAVMCHYGFEPVPPFRDRYHARADEAAADVLCGLWSVGPSTFYRYLDKGERLLAQALSRPPQGPQSTAVRRFVEHELAPLAEFDSDAQRAAWHRHQAQTAAASGDMPSALWHYAAAQDAGEFLQLLRRNHAALAIDQETDELCALVAAVENLTARQRFDLCLAQAALWRARNEAESESQEYEQALRIATMQDDPLMLGIVYGALGKFHEPRDADRAFACYEESADFLRRAGPVDNKTAIGGEVTTEYTTTLVRLAWLHVLRNDPQSRTVLDSAQKLRSQHDVPPDVAAMLEQAWGEYWRRAGEHRRSLEHMHRALNLYERLGDQRSVLATYNNLSLIYGQLKEFDRAIDYARRVVDASARVSVEPEILISVHLNLGATFFWQARYDDAIKQYQAALDGSRAAGLALHSWRAHYNLAEAYYKRFQATRDADDERLGDAHSAAALAIDQDAERTQATRGLKGEVLGTDASANRLLPQELATHFEETTEVQRQRAVLAIPIEPAAHVRAHLAIARSYLSIATKEREAAIALIQKHGLREAFDDEFAQLKQTFERELTREQRLAAQWKQATGDMISDERRIAVLNELLRTGAINKSGYAQVSGLGLATASKHLGLLAERGLLVQTGKGPSTRYQLPQGR